MPTLVTDPGTKSLEDLFQIHVLTPENMWINVRVFLRKRGYQQRLLLQQLEPNRLHKNKHASGVRMHEKVQPISPHLFYITSRHLSL